MDNHKNILMPPRNHGVFTLHKADWEKDERVVKSTEMETII